MRKYLLTMLQSLLFLLILAEPSIARRRFVDTGNELYWTTGSRAEKGFITSSSLEFIPAQRCTPTQIIIRFKADFNITGGDKIAIGLAGFTSGKCDNVEGDPITGIMDEIKWSASVQKGELKLSPNSKFKGGYKEGLVAAGFQDSKLLFTVTPGTKYANGTEVVIDVDQGNFLKANCGIDRNGNGNFTIAVQAQALGPWTDASGARQQIHAVTSAVVNSTNSIEGGCPVTDTKIRLDPPVPKQLTDITLSFRPGTHLRENDNVTIILGGFTSGDGIMPGADIPFGRMKVTTIVSRFNRALLDLTFKAPDAFNVSWTEGVPEPDKPGYNTSKLKLRVNPGFSFEPGVHFDILVNRSNGIRANCGLPGTFDGIKLRASVSQDPDYPRASRNIAETSFSAAPRGSIQAVGDGCRSALNYCNGNGQCDYCLNRCICNRGFGGPGDVFDRRAKKPDCSGRVCPAAISFTNFVPFVALNVSTNRPVGMANGGLGSESVVGPGGAVEAANQGRKIVECSGAGTCDYSQGHCKCAPGWTGGACERRECPGGNQKPCSGHGQCLSMKQLANHPEALPLTQKDTNGHAHYDDAGLSSLGAWDATILHGCVCDSSWKVGLGANETQEPEWFGPDCSLRHCPSGDDPVTPHIDELNCTNVIAAGGRGIGERGNRCHVDCSNRGRCDFSTGLCTCFDGFVGSNCGTPISALWLNKAR